MNMRKKQQAATRRAILRALGEQIAETGTMGFAIKDVAQRAGVTHRTVYNHFPTRHALNDAYAVHVEEELRGELESPPDDDIDIAELPALMRSFFPVLAKYEAMFRAYVMLMIASRAEAQVARDRAGRWEAKMEGTWGPFPAGAARAAMVAVRMFASSTGWHLLTEHHGLSQREATTTAAWATRILLEAVKRGDVPEMETDDEPSHDH